MIPAWAARYIAPTAEPQRRTRQETSSAAITYRAGRMTIILRLVRTAVWSEIAAAAAKVNKHNRAHTQVGEFHSARWRQPPAARSTMAVPTNSAREGTPPNDM